MILSLGAPVPAMAQHAGLPVASARASAGFVAFPELAEVGVSFELVGGVNLPIWSVDEPAPREGWGMTIEGGALINAGGQLGLVGHGLVTVGVDYQFEWLAVGPVATAFVGWGPRELSVGGRLGVRVEALLGIFGLDVSCDGRAYDGRALFGVDVRLALDLGAAIHILVGLTGGGLPPPTDSSRRARSIHALAS
ncbi:MAG: hypothetical protein KF729_38960 [Sandaracinaceae bacterium]|nr:hypothetical protein [Sandaracinaceae bacterium]